MNYKSLISLILVLTFSGCWSPEGDDLIKSDFDKDAEDWTIYNDGVLTYVANGGVGQTGYIQGTDLGLGSCWGYQAPAKFLNNISQFAGGRMRFFLYQNSPSGIGTCPESDIIIVSGNGTMVHNFNRIPGNDWTEYTVSMGDLDWRTPEGAYLSNDQIFDILSDVLSIRIRGEYGDDLDTEKALNPINSIVNIYDSLLFQYYELFPVILEYI